MLSSREGEMRKIFHSATPVLKICTLLGLQYFACSGKKSNNPVAFVNFLIDFGNQEVLRLV